MAAAQEKRVIRQNMRRILAALSDEKEMRDSAKAAENFRGLPAYKDAGFLLAFLSMKHEIRTDSLIGSALADGKLVAVPRMEKLPGLSDMIRFVPLSRDYQDWPRDSFGIPTPPADRAALTEEELGHNSVIVAAPGLAFDRRGGRLGRGKGYYDGFLASARAAAAEYKGSLLACGFCYEVQVLDALPLDDRDQSVDFIATEKEALACIVT